MGDVLHAALVGALDVVAEGEEGIGTEGHLGVLGNPCFLFFWCEGSGLFSEELLPCTFAKDIFVFIADVYVDGVVAVGTADAFFEWEGENLGALAEPPDVGFVTSKTGAVDAALLTCSDAD